MKPFVVYELDRPRTMRFSIKGIKMIESLFKKDLSEIVFEALRPDDLVKVIYAGLCSEDPELTLEKTEELLDQYSTIGEIMAKMTEALTESFKQPEVAGDSKK